MDIQDMCIFARVSAVQNLSAVGNELGLTPGTISKRIQALEDELSVRLFDRTTRSIRITEEGAKFLVHVERILAEIECARAAVGANVEQPKGRLKISAPASLGRQLIGPAICSFMEAYPEIEVQIDLTDRIVNLQEEGYDVVVRTGELTDSSLVAKRLAPDHQMIVAAPCYLEGRGVPQTPGDLSRHCCLILGDVSHWAFAKDGRETTIRVSGRLRSNNGDLLRHAAVQGQGLLRISELRASGALRDGKLIPVLTDYEVAAASAIWALYPKNKHILPKLRVFLDFLGEWFRDLRSDSRIVGSKSVPDAEFSANVRPRPMLRTHIGGAVGAVAGLTRGNGRAR
jgi:DNA-binding transcriptional LysR family regulator